MAGTSIHVQGVQAADFWLESESLGQLQFHMGQTVAIAPPPMGALCKPPRATVLDGNKQNSLNGVALSPSEVSSKASLILIDRPDALTRGLDHVISLINVQRSTLMPVAKFSMNYAPVTVVVSIPIIHRGPVVLGRHRHGTKL